MESGGSTKGANVSGRDEDLSWIRKAEALLAGLRSVRGVQITAESAGRGGSGGPETPHEIAEIHIICDGDRSPKQIVRDVRTALNAGLKLDVDYRKISIVQRRPDAPDDANPTIIELVPGVERPPGGPRRVRFGGVTVSQSALRCSVHVELALGEREVMGEADGPTGRQQVPRLIAEATLRGLERFIAEDYRLSLGQLEVLSLGGDTIVVASVRCTGDRRQQTLSGSCVVDHDLQQSVVYATLAALNRSLERLPIREHVEYELRPTSISSGPEWRGF